ncbi:MAG: hypothetical protein M3R15_14080, partial [Acidobacteriota bacterium]|nr:hypothetical protein [Acidobacteriota bacterium]
MNDDYRDLQMSTTADAGSACKLLSSRGHEYVDGAYFPSCYTPSRSFWRFSLFTTFQNIKRCRDYDLFIYA